MTLFKNLKTGTKIVVPFVFSLFVLVVVISIVTNYYFNKNYEQETQKLITGRINHVQKNIDDICSKALYGASICAGLDVVQRAYKAYYITNNLDSCSNIIESEFRSINDLIQTNTGLEARIQFHLPPAQSFIRCWTTTRGDDLSSYRKSLLKINKTHVPVTGIETERSGLVLVGISPVFSNRGKYFGSNEILFPINKLVEQLKDEQGEDFAIYMHSEQLKIATQFYENPITKINQENIRIGNFLFVDQTSEEFKVTNLTEPMLNAGFTGLSNFEVGDYKYACSPLKDFDGNTIGVAVFQLDVANYKSDMFNIRLSLIILLFALLFLTVWFAIWITGILITKEVKQVAKVLTHLSLGKLAKDLEVTSNDEMNQMKSALNALNNGLRRTASFANQIGKGNLEVNYEPLSDEDVLGNALIEMRNSLNVAVQTENKRRIEDEERNWITRGQAIIEEILRQQTDMFNSIAPNVIKGIVKYITATLGGIFIYIDDNPDDLYLDQVATFAYDRKKFLQKKIKVGEGLVGMAVLEKSTVFKTEIPKDYIEIKSAFGDTIPTSLLIVPLKFEENIFGVIELAAMHKFKPNEIKFVEKVAESIASAVSRDRTNRRTSNLLLQSRKQADELSQKESELRDNISKLQITQEEAAIQQAETKSFMDSVNQTIIRADFRLDGRLIYANPKFLETMQFLISEASGQHVSIFIEDKDRDTFTQDWRNLVHNGNLIEKRIRHKTKYGHVWLLSTFTPIFDINKRIDKVLFLGIDINQDRLKFLDFQGTLNAVDSSVCLSIYKPDGTIVKDNDILLNTLHYEFEETVNKNIFNFIDEEKMQHFRIVWNQVMSGQSVSFEEYMMTKEGEQKWFRGTYSPIRDYDGMIYKIIYLAVEITEYKAIEKRSLQQTEELRIKEQKLRISLEKFQSAKRDLDRLRKGVEPEINTTDGV